MLENKQGHKQRLARNTWLPYWLSVGSYKLQLSACITGSR